MKAAKSAMIHDTTKVQETSNSYNQTLTQKMREGWERKDVILPPPPVPNITHVQACVANVSVWFQSKTRLRNRIFGFRRTRNKSRFEK